MQAIEAVDEPQDTVKNFFDKKHTSGRDRSVAAENISAVMDRWKPVKISIEDPKEEKNARLN